MHSRKLNPFSDMESYPASPILNRNVLGYSPSATTATPSTQADPFSPSARTYSPAVELHPYSPPSKAWTSEPKPAPYPPGPGAYPYPYGSTPPNPAPPPAADYSTLEVRQESGAEVLEPVENLPEVVPGSYRGPVAVWQESDGDGRDKRKRCGLRPLVFWLIVAGATLLVVLVVILGSVLGVMSSRDDRGGGGDEGSSDRLPPGGDDAPGNGTLERSRISALSWEDDAGTSRRAVFYQADDFLYMMRRDPESGAWGEFNISSQFDPALTLRASTPLATSAKPRWAGDFDATLYFIDSGGRVREIVSTAGDLGEWTRGALWDVTRSAGGASDLAVFGYYCDDGPCWNERMLAYQSSRGPILMMDGRNWAASPQFVTSVAAGSPIAMASTPWWNGTAVSNGNASTIRLYHYREQRIDEMIFNDKKPLGWNSGRLGVVESFSTNGRWPYVTAASWANPEFPLLLSLDAGGDVTASFMAGKEDWVPENQSRTTFWANPDGTKSTLSPREGVAAMAMTHDFALYTITADGSRVMEWAWSAVNPFHFASSGVVLQR